MSMKAAYTSSDPILTDTVVDQAQQELNEYSVNKSARAKNAYGKTVDKGGQYLGIGFIEGVCNTYSNLVYRPFALLSLIIVMLFYCNKIAKLTTDSNLYYMAASNVIKYGDTTKSAFGKSIAWIVGYILTLLHTYGDEVTMAIAMWFPYLGKSSKYNAVYSSIFMTFWIFYSKHYFSVFMFSQAYFLFTQLRDPKQKFFVIMLGIIGCCIGNAFIFDLFNIKGLSTTYKGKAGASPPPITTSTTPATKPDEPVGTIQFGAPEVILEGVDETYVPGGLVMEKPQARARRAGQQKLLDVTNNAEAINNSESFLT